jgi:hypothetical protein
MVRGLRGRVSLSMGAPLGRMGGPLTGNSEIVGGVRKLSSSVYRRCVKGKRRGWAPLLGTLKVK